MVGRATLANAIAYVHITQASRGMHATTYGELMSYYEFADRPPHYRFTEAALVIAAEAPMWTAYLWLKENGFQLWSNSRHDMRSIEFWHPNMDVGKRAFIDRWGYVLIVPEAGKWNSTHRFNPSKGETHAL